MLYKQNETVWDRRRIFFVAVTGSDGVTILSGLTITGSDGGLQISKNGGAFQNVTGPAAVEVGSTGLYYYPLTQAELDTTGSLIAKFVKPSVARTVVWQAGQVVTWDPYDSVRQGMTALPNAAAQAAGGLYTQGTGAGQINQNANGQIDTRIVGASAGSITSGALAPGAIAPLVLSAGSILSGTMAPGSIPALVLAQNSIIPGVFTAASIVSGTMAPNAIPPLVLGASAILSGTIGPNAITDTNTAQSQRWAMQQLIMSASVEGTAVLYQTLQWLVSVAAGNAPQLPSGSGDFQFLALDGSTVRLSGSVTAAGVRTLVSRS